MLWNLGRLLKQKYFSLEPVSEPNGPAMGRKWP